uniref:Homeobox domain-containing protein n=1 Tax=Poecilia reticulata TaxID=8081 RepID=A0A3P9P528_POERE
MTFGSSGKSHCRKETELQERKSKGKRYRDMRRSRTIIQAEQLDILYGCYFKDPNPGKHEFEQIAEWVHLPKKVVQIWFQNMRARERKGEVRFISDGTLAAVGKPLIKFTWPLSKPIFSNKTATNNAGGIPATPIVRTLIKTEKEPEKELAKTALVKKVIPVPIKPKEVAYPTAGSPVSSSVTAVPKTKLEASSNVSMLKVSSKVPTPVLYPPPKEPETLTGHCDACNVSFESRAAARAHVFSPHHLGSLSTAVTSPGAGSEGEIVIELPPSTATSNS